MILQNTPHIRIAPLSGQVDKCSCWIKNYNYDENQYAFSYNTVIGIYTSDLYYLETAGSYSTTTAGKHKPRCQSIARHNNFKIVPDVKPETLAAIYRRPEELPEILPAILEESQQRRQLLDAINNNRTENSIALDLKVKGILNASRKPETKNFKNGNRDTVHYYRTNFKYVSNLEYKEVTKAKKQRLETSNSKPGKAKTGSTYYKYSSKAAVIYSYL